MRRQEAQDLEHRCGLTARFRFEMPRSWSSAFLVPKTWGSDAHQQGQAGQQHLELTQQGSLTL